MLDSISPWLGALALGVLLLGGGRFVRDAQRVAVSANAAGILSTLYVAFALAVAALGTALFRAEPLAPALGLAALPLLFAPALLFVMHRRKTPVGDIRVREGDCLPRSEALRADGTRFDSAELRGRRVLFKVYRGFWCPFCSAELRQFEALRPELEARGIRLVALSKDDPAATSFHAARDGLGFPLLSDPQLKVIRQLGLEHHKALEISGGRFHILGFPLGYRPSFKAMAIPTTFLLDEHGRIRWIDQTTDYRVRADATRVREALADAFGPAPLGADGELPPLPEKPGVVLAPCG